MATKLLAILILLGAIAVLLTSILGYVRARQALEEAIYDQLSVARQTKARQVETYFRTVRQDLQLLARSKMVVDAMRSFRSAFDELEGKPVDRELSTKLADWYDKNFIPEVGHLLDEKVSVADYLPRDSAAIYLQYHYIVRNQHPKAQRRLLDDPVDGSAYSAVHAIFHPLMRTATHTVGFFDFLLIDPKSGRLVYETAKEVDFATSLHTGPYRTTNVAAAAAQCAAVPDPSVTCLEDFKPYLPSDGLPAAFMAAPVVDQGVVTGVLVAQLSIDEIERVVTGNKHWRQQGFGATGETYLVGPDYLVRAGGRLFFENRDRFFEELRRSGTPEAEIDAIKRYGSPILHQEIDTVATRAAVAGIEGTGRIRDSFGRETLSSWGPVDIAGVKWGLVSRITTAEAFAPIHRLERELAAVGGLALLTVIIAGAWFARSLLNPLRELTAGVKRFTAGDRTVKVAVRSQDEIGQLCTAFNGMVDELSTKNSIIETKNRENEELLLNVLPAPIANRLRGGEQSIADGFAEVSVAFADLVGFTALSSDMPPQNVVTLLNGLFTRFDVAAQELGIEKIKTVGDAYMAVCGLPVPMEDHAERIVRMAIRMVHITREHALENKVSMKLRVGVNTGPVVAGVIGRSKYIYDLWGDTVNLASRMESGGIPDTIQVTRPVYEKLKDKFSFESRGLIEVKGKGSVEAWLLRL
ncbi:MAG: HAMP domain-containing protein [Proteobacteria bacterium]|nr:HAMP domain-containing protein [Pseudomonadota bacterium]